MKKLLCLIMALSMILALAACGGQAAGSAAAEAPASTAAEAAPEAAPAEEAAPAGEAAPAEEAAPEADPFEGLEPVTLKMAATVNENEIGGQIMAEFLNYVTENTNGLVTFDTFYGGVLGSAMEELQLVSSGAVDLIPLGHNPHAESLPLLNGPSWVNGSEEDAVNYFNYLVFENEETSALIKAEAEANNIVYLGFQPSGKNVFVSKVDGASFADLEGKQLGAMANQTLFQSLGFVVVTTAPPDTYESLSRGVIDVARLSFTAAINMKWYEVAKTWLYDGTAAAGSPFTMNLDTWNSLPAAYQEVFYAAAKHAEEYGLKLASESEAENVAFLESQGCTVNEMSAEDQTLFFESLVDITLQTCRERAERLGISENQETVIAATLEYLGLSE